MNKRFEKQVARIAARFPKSAKKFELILKDALREIWPTQTYSEAVEAVERVAEKHGGAAWNTGGGMIVGYVKVDDSTWIGVSDECVVAYHTSKPLTQKEIKAKGSHEGLYHLAMCREDGDEPGNFEVVWLREADKDGTF